jgi:DNA repair protein RecO (recombination protein O)
MLFKTKGMVLHTIPYKETSIIAKIYTEEWGIQSYIENGVRSSKGKNKIALFQPLTFLDMVVYHDSKKELHRISEIKCFRPYKTIPYDIAKSSIALFLIEVIQKCIRETGENRALFDFLEISFHTFDNQSDGSQNFHLLFLLQFCRYLGFEPETAEELSQQVHKEVGWKVENLPLLNQLIQATYQTDLHIHRKERNHLLDSILWYYRVHIDNFGEVKSLAIIREIFH